MKKSLSIKRLSLGVLLAFGSFSTLAADNLPYYDSEEFTPQWLEPFAPELDGLHRIPSFKFLNQDGEYVTDRTLQNDIYVANFFFTTCPGICPMVRSKLSRVQDAFADDENVKILSHSIRPTTDTVETLKEYAEMYGIQSDKWHLVTGDKDEIYELAKSAYFASEDLGNIENTNDFLHTENLLLIDQNKNIRGIYNGLNTTSVNYLIADIKALKEEREALMDCH